MVTAAGGRAWARAFEFALGICGGASHVAAGQEAPNVHVSVEGGGLSFARPYNANVVSINAEDSGRAVWGAPIATGAVPVGISGKVHFLSLGFGSLGGGGRVHYWSASVPLTTFVKPDGKWQRTIESSVSGLLIEGEFVLRFEALSKLGVFPYVSATLGAEREGLSFAMSDVDLGDPAGDSFLYKYAASDLSAQVSIGGGIEWAPARNLVFGAAIHLRAGPSSPFTVTSASYTRSTSGKGDSCSGPHVPCAVVPKPGGRLPSYEPGGAAAANRGGLHGLFRVGLRF